MADERKIAEERVTARKGFLIVALGFAATLGVTGQQAPEPQLAVAASTQAAVPELLPEEAQTQLVSRYCVACHNDRMETGGLTLEEFDASQVVERAEVTEKMIRKVRAGMMPPPGRPRPDAETLSAFVETLETTIDTAAARNPNPGWRPFQRLNRAEYAQAIHDLLGLEIDVAAYLPADPLSGGFDNVADVQTFSATLLQGYLRAASDISVLAVGNPTASHAVATFRASRTTSQVRRIEGAPIGTRGGISAVHNFPADGEYVIRVSLYPHGASGAGGFMVGRETMISRDISEQIDVSIDGERVALLDVDPNQSEGGPQMLDVTTPPAHIKAGPRRVTAAFVRRLEGPVDDLYAPLGNSLADLYVSFGVTMLPHLREMKVIGPSRVSGVSDNVSRQMVFTCWPTTAEEEEPCATAIVERLTAQAYRGKATEADIRDALNFYRQGRASGSFEGGIQLALQSILMSPQFLFRLEEVSATSKGQETYRVSDVDLASRLSFFLWGTLPDADLINAAQRGELGTSLGLEREVKRMLAHPHAETLSTRFASQWLRLQDLEHLFPDPLLYPHYNDQLARAMRRETELFFDSIVREDRSVFDLLTADYSFVNELLATHYGIPNIGGTAFRRVTMPANRRGLLGHGSILALTSFPDRTSPVLRGKWVMEVLLGTPPPPPPPDVPALDESAASTDGARLLSTRERVEQHRKSPVCSACHRFIDPLGLALENFDNTGKWRRKDNGVPVDSLGELYDGTQMDGAEGVRQALLKHSDMVIRQFTESLLTYALGRRIEYFDMPTVREIVKEAATDDYRISSLILGVVKSRSFHEVKPNDTVVSASATRP